MDRLAILGSTGSIGVQALDVMKGLNKKVVALSAHHHIEKLEEQIRAFKPAMAAVMDKGAAKALKDNIHDTSCKVFAGMDGLCEMTERCNADTVLNAVVGIAGLLPTLAAIGSGKNIALANKETLVAGGSIVMETAKRKGIQILPVDSEHSAIFQCLESRPKNNAINRLILTASGGPFFGKTAQDLINVTPAQALKHPNWDMGRKILIDSATMMNKGLELIEAVWLFEVTPSMVDIIVHRESIVHSLVEYSDHSVMAQLGVPDMRIPIQYALTYPDRFPSPAKQLNLTDLASLTFAQPDYQTFTCISACKKAIEKGGLYPAAVNGANEAAVELFLNGKISFNDIGRMVNLAVNFELNCQDYTVEEVLKTDQMARQAVESAAGIEYEHQNNMR